MNIENELRAIEEKAKGLMEENKTLKAHLLTQKQQPKGLDGHVAKRLNDVVKVPCDRYTKEEDGWTSLEKIEMVDGTIITIERESN